VSGTAQTGTEAGAGAAAASVPAHGAGAPAKAVIPPSVLILTKNEEVNIEACLRTLTFSDDIVVLDSYSDDRTLELAARFPNVRIVQRKFDTWSKHSNWAMEHIAFKHPWVYYSDADERVTPELRDEIMRIVNDPGTTPVAFRLRYKNMFLGSWLRWGGLYPVWIIRLFRPDKIRYEDREVNAHPVVSGALGDLQGHFIHYSFNKGLVPWFTKHNSYSTMEANEAVRVRQTSVWAKLEQIRSRQPGVARRAMKDLSFFLPMRGLVRFIYMYFLRLGFLNWRAGLLYALMISMYEYWIELKVAEREREWRTRTEAEVARLLKGSAPAGPQVQGPPVDERGEPLIEVMIPTFNEAAHIRETIENARQLGPVHVLDSFSTDGTQELSRQAGATVVEHRFESYSKQKNWGLANLPWRGRWVFILDADERVTPELRDELIRIARSGESATGYFVNRVVVFMGRQVRHGGLYPSWNLRFFRRGSCHYEDRSVHEHMICNGPTAYADHLMVHIRRESISEYIAKHVRYADMESEEWVKQDRREGGGAEPSRLFKDRLALRQLLRRKVWPRMPFKPLVRFVYMYLFRLGILDGRAGWHLAQLMACYEFMTQLLYTDKTRTTSAEERAQA
jgi:glycosyltransferase involved in cell wall biosynthesis